jgi:FkbM family methyltransferase
MTPLRRLVRHLGYDLTPLRKARSLPDQLAAVLRHHRISCVLDVGANVGQYGRMLRASGYRGRIVSFEPLADAHAALVRSAAGDPAWQVAPRMALGAEDGEIRIQVSAESDMSSILSQSPILREISPSSQVVGEDSVPLRRLDDVGLSHLAASDRGFLKVDVQGYEAQVLAGASRLLDRLIGLQLEMSLVPCYEGERDFRTMLDQLDEMGFELHLLWPGYFERSLARQLQVDGVFLRRGRGEPS